MNYAVYPYQPGDTLLSFVKDLSKDTIVTQIGTIFEAVPRWAPDGKSFALRAFIRKEGTSVGGLYRIYLDGHIDLLIDSPSDQDIERTSYQWSPDGKYIAFWWDPVGILKCVTLGVLNVETSEIVTYDIHNSYLPKFAPEIYWSPDSQYLIFELKDSIEDETSKLVVVDTVSGWAAQIGENMSPWGWMVSAP